MLLFTHRGKTVYASLTEIEIDFSPAGKPNLNGWISAVYMFTEKEQIYFKHHPGWMFGGEWWEERKNIKLPGLPPTHNWYPVNRWFRTELYEDNLKSVFEKSCLKYLYDNDLFETYEFQPEDYIRYISLGLKYQSIEMLNKAGFDKLVANKVLGKSCGHTVNWRGMSLKKILKLPKRHIRKLQQWNPDIGELKAFNMLTEKEKKEASYKDVEYLSSLNLTNLEKIRKYTELLRWARYGEEQKRKYYFTGDWLDYIDSCNELGMDITKKATLFPADFEAAHDEVLEKVKVQIDKARDAAMLSKTFELAIEKENLIAIMARTQEELNKESQNLKHCVRTYGDKVIGGGCYIFFIRKAETPDISYFTLETNVKGEIRQCRGFKNCSMTEDVKGFVDEVEKELKKLLPKLIKERSVA